MEVGRSPLEQEVDEGNRLGVGESLHLVECENAWSIKGLDGLQQRPDTAGESALVMDGNRPFGNVQSRVPEGEREMGFEHRRPVPLVDG